MSLLLYLKAKDTKSFKVSAAMCRLTRLIVMTSVVIYMGSKIMASVRLFAFDPW